MIAFGVRYLPILSCILPCRSHYLSPHSFQSASALMWYYKYKLEWFPLFSLHYGIRFNSLTAALDWHFGVAETQTCMSYFLLPKCYRGIFESETIKLFVLTGLWNCRGSWAVPLERLWEVWPFRKKMYTCSRWPAELQTEPWKRGRKVI